MVDGRTTPTDGRAPARWVYYKLSSPCEPNGSGVIKKSNEIPSNIPIMIDLIVYLVVSLFFI